MYYVLPISRSSTALSRKSILRPPGTAAATTTSIPWSPASQCTNATGLLRLSWYCTRMVESKWRPPRTDTKYSLDRPQPAYILVCLLTLLFFLHFPLLLSASLTVSLPAYSLASFRGLFSHLFSFFFLVLPRLFFSLLLSSSLFFSLLLSSSLFFSLLLPASLSFSLLSSFSLRLSSSLFVSLSHLLFSIYNPVLSSFSRLFCAFSLLLSMYIYMRSTSTSASTWILLRILRHGSCTGSAPRLPGSTSMSGSGLTDTHRSINVKSLGKGWGVWLQTWTLQMRCLHIIFIHLRGGVK